MRKEEILYVENLETDSAYGQNLDAVSFVLHKGEVFGITGRSGDGFWALQNVLTGRIRPAKGQIYLEGKKVTFRNEDQARRQGLVFLDHRSAIVPRMTAAENMNVLRPFSWKHYFVSPGQNRKAVRMIQAEYGIRLEGDAQGRQLTRLERLELIFCRAILNGSKVLICQEAGDGLTGPEREAFQQFLQKVREKDVAVILLNSDPGVLLQFADRIGVLWNGMFVYKHRRAETCMEELVRYMKPRWTFPPVEEARPGKEGREFSPWSARVSIEPEGWETLSLPLEGGRIVGLYWDQTSFEDLLYGIFQGKIRISGQMEEEGACLPLRQWIQMHRAEIFCIRRGFVRKNICNNLTVAENILLGSYRRFDYRGGLLNRAMLRMALGDFARAHGIEEAWLEAYPPNLDTEVQEQIPWWRVLFGEPKLLVMDNPAFAMGASLRKRLHLILEELKRSPTATLWTSRDRGLLEESCDLILDLDPLRKE